MGFVKSTPTQLKDFLESFIWQDLKGEVEEWIQDLQLILEDPDGSTEPHVLSVTRGSIRACRNFLNMPEVILENLVEDAGRAERKRKRELKKEE